MRAKGQRNPENKFMTGATVDDYVMGRLRDPKSKSPGLAANTLAMCELVYRSSKGQRPNMDASTETSTHPAAATVRRQTCGSRKRRVAPVMGFRASGDVDEAVAEDGSAKPEVELAELMELEGSDELTDSAAMHSLLKDSFGERAADVLSVLKLWESFGKLYSAACAAWENDTTEYRAKRAVAFLRAGTACLSNECLTICVSYSSAHLHQSTR
eukprot:6189603-Pleurochrysis_carterae.AAC.2